jgi:capsular exopolysaccharide synthesis family protein
LITLTGEESLAAEKFRYLGVRLRQLQQGRKLKKVLITSAIAEEGKSFVSANLATTLARRRQQKVLLLEGDLRRPVFAQEFGLPKLPGLSEWLQGDGTRIENIYNLDRPPLWILPAGKPPENPLELIQSGKLSNLFERLTTWFDWIVIDSPPLLPLADTTVWARLADGVLLVVREGKTEKRLLKQGLEALQHPGLLGIVFNHCSDVGQTNYYQRYAQVGQNSNAGFKVKQSNP